VTVQQDAVGQGATVNESGDGEREAKKGCAVGDCHVGLSVK